MVCTSAILRLTPTPARRDVVRYSVFQDAGKAVHPSYVENQMQGGAAQGIGWALNEEYFMNEDGSMANFSFLDYRMPTSLDLADDWRPISWKFANPMHPFGVRGVGEVPIAPSARCRSRTPSTTPSAFGCKSSR